MAKFMIVNRQANAPGTTAYVTILEASPHTDEQCDPLPSPAPFSAQVIQHEGRGLQLLAPCPIAVNAAVKIEASEAIWLGTVESCSEANPVEGPALQTAGAAGDPDAEPDGERTWHVAIHVTRVLRDIDTLKRLANLFGAGKMTNSSLFRGLPVQV